MTEVSTLPLDELGRVIAEPARLRILHELLGGPPLPAGALAARTGIAPSTTSAHLSRLEAAGLIRIERRGRSRMARLAGPEVADAIEALVRLSGEAPVSSLTGFDRRTAMREARSCYDHLAGRVGVAIADITLERGWVRADSGSWTLVDGGIDPISHDLGIALAWPPSRRAAVRPCADWTERRPHIAGRLGRALLDAMIESDWVRRRRDDRALRITAVGKARLAELGVADL